LREQAAQLGWSSAAESGKPIGGKTLTEVEGKTRCAAVATQKNDLCRVVQAVAQLGARE
jgi:hypothetical protein